MAGGKKKKDWLCSSETYSRCEKCSRVIFIENFFFFLFLRGGGGPGGLGSGAGDKQLVEGETASGKLTRRVKWKRSKEPSQQGAARQAETPISQHSFRFIQHRDSISGPAWLPYFTSFLLFPIPSYLKASTFRAYCDRNIPSRQSKEQVGSLRSLRLSPAPSERPTDSSEAAWGRGLTRPTFLKGPRYRGSLKTCWSCTASGGKLCFDTACVGSNCV